jgi:hypothetical protein
MSIPAAVHARQEMRRRRSVRDPDESWRCCPNWPRQLLNKWNGREFAVRHGATVPELYELVGHTRHLVPESLPSPCVLRPLRGTNDRGVAVLVDGRELIADEDCPPGRLPSWLGRGPYLLEEFVGRADGSMRLPVEYKCHTFAGRVAAVQVIERRSRRPKINYQRHYTPDWVAFYDPMSRSGCVADPEEAPPFLEDMLGASARIGAAVGTYMRVDFLGGESGAVFAEFSSTPGLSGPGVTPFCDELFGRLWDEECPDAL